MGNQDGRINFQSSASGWRRIAVPRVPRLVFPNDPDSLIHSILDAPPIPSENSLGGSGATEEVASD
jgi:hypothetical protein